MDDPILAIVLTGLFTLLGTIAGYVASVIQASKQFKRQKELENTRRVWQIEDSERIHKLSVKERRCDQAEEFVSAMTEDFHQLRTHSIFLVNMDPRMPIEEEIFEFGYWQKNIDRSVFQYGPVIDSLSDAKFDLVSPWKEMEQAWQNMAHHYQFVYKQKAINREKIDKPQELLQAIDNVYGVYNRALGDFIVQIDNIRAKPFLSSPYKKLTSDHHQQPNG